MKKTMKRVLSGLFCLILLLSFCGTALAADQTGTLTVTGTADAIGSTVEGYQIFTIAAEGTGVDTTYTYTLNTKYTDFFKTLSIEGFDTMTAEQQSNAAYKYVLALNKEAKRDAAVNEFADRFTKWIHDNSKTSDLPTPAVTMAADGENSKATIANVPYGYYLIFVGHAPASLVNVKAATGNEVKVKSAYPTVDKKVINHGIPSEATSAEIGNSVSFVLTSTVPDMDGYTSYVFNFKDTMSKGLTFNSESVVVKIGTETLTRVYLKEGRYYTDKECTTEVAADAQNTKSYVVTSVKEGDQTKVTIELLNFIQYKGAAYKDAEITVNYSARLNKDASINTADTNKATVEYSNDPKSDSRGESTPEVVEVYTFDFNINKVAHGTNIPLAGAEFVLRRSNADGAEDIKLVSTGANEYRLADADDAAESIVTKVTTDETGKIKIQGLAKGTYYLYETKAPENYNRLTTPVVIDITAETNPDGTIKAWYVNKTDDSTSGDNTVTVENRSGSTLPETGAIGTAVFAVVGVGLVIGGTQLMGRKKKNEEAEQ